MMLLFFMSWLYFDQLIQTHNIVFDVITEYLIIWNFGVGGLFAIHWKGQSHQSSIFRKTYMSVSVN